MDFFDQILDIWEFSETPLPLSPLKNQVGHGMLRLGCCMVELYQVQGKLYPLITNLTLLDTFKTLLGRYGHLLGVALPQICLKTRYYD